MNVVTCLLVKTVDSNLIKHRIVASITHTVA